MHQEKASKRAAKDDDVVPAGAVPAYLIDREGVNRAKARRG
jgi:ribosome biogenesis protein NSA2